MKYAIIAVIAVAVLFIISQVWAKKSVNNIEMYPYEVLKEYDGFEIRKYEPANFTYVTMESSEYNESSGNGFRSLAGYIFGGNSENQEIAMTSPVEMELKDSITMKFMVPAEYDLNEMPTPNDSKVKFKREPEKVVAAITFGGWANDKRITEYTERLKTLLAEAGIKHNGNFSFMGYNPPFELINRRNEIVVEVML